jgi:hypothetical protein
LGYRFCGVESTRRRLELVRRLWRGYPTPPPVFFAKSAELHENKRVVFFEVARKCKRVRKSLKRKDMTEKP